jgi:hypothetical protein
MAMTLASAPKLLRPGLLEVRGKYRDSPKEWEGIYTTKKSNLSVETSVQVRYTGTAKVKTEGAMIYADNEGGERASYNMQAVEAALQYSVSRKFIDDNLYKTDFDPANLGLANGMRSFWNIQAAIPFNTAGTYDPTVGGDGKALLATDHPNDIGTWGNTTTIPQSLNEASLIAGGQAIRGYRDEAGILQDIEQDELLIPLALEAVAKRLIHSELRPGTGNNDVNVIPHISKGLKGYRVWRYLTSPFPWFLTTSVKGFIHLQRTPFETDMHVDFDTMNLKVNAYERAGFFRTDPRAVYGQMATA